MIIDLRKSARSIDYLPVTIDAISGVDGRTIAGPFSSRIIDFSTGGACLLMTQVLQNRYHIFHSTRENNSTLLLLSIAVPPDSEVYTIKARPVWMDKFQQRHVRAFKVGVEFLSNPEGKFMTQITNILKKGSAKRGKWWTETCSILRSKKK